MNNKIAVIGLSGESNFYKVPHFAVSGETVLARECSTEYGGKGMNQAIATSRMGSSVSYLTVCGNDAVNEEIRNVLNNEKIDYFRQYHHDG